MSLAVESAPVKRRKMPKQKPGTSEQTVETPPEFIAAVELMFGHLGWDLAALKSNSKAICYLGPDHDECNAQLRDSLQVNWSALCGRHGVNWLNPPFSHIAPWAAKCAYHAAINGTQVLMLVPASIGSNWYETWVAPNADVYSVGRMKFVGHDHLYPKDLILAHFWKLGGNKLKRWRWEK